MNQNLTTELYNQIMLSESDDEKEEQASDKNDYGSQKDFYVKHFQEIQFNTKNKQKKKRK